MPSKALELKKRRVLYQHILRNPGLHLRALERDMRMGLGDLRHHLGFLEREGLIMTATDGYRKTYFPGKKEFSGDKALLGLLRQSKPRAILLILLNAESGGFDYLRRKVGVSKSTLSFHMKKLEEAGIVAVQEDRQRKTYTLPDKNKVAELLITYRPSFLDAAVDRALEAWLG
jgi:predicted transcriptional regulator